MLYKVDSYEHDVHTHIHRVMVTHTHRVGQSHIHTSFIYGIFGREVTKYSHIRCTYSYTILTNPNYIATCITQTTTGQSADAEGLVMLGRRPFHAWVLASNVIPSPTFEEIEPKRNCVDTVLLYKRQRSCNCFVTLQNIKYMTRKI